MRTLHLLRLKFRPRPLFLYLLPALLVPALAIVALAADPWSPSQVIQPETLARQLAGAKNKPVILQVGFSQLYEQAHIPGSKYCGPAFRPAGMTHLKDCAQKIAKTQEIVIYCGCCPWQDCPNVRPAFEALEKMGFTHLKVLYIPHNFGQDWVKKGFPVEPSR